MKTSLVVRIFFTFIVSFLTVTVNAQANIANVGVVKNNEGVVTDLNEATRVLKGGLSAQAAVSRAWIEFSPTENKYYLIGQISNDPVSGKAVQLQQNGNVLLAAAGPGIEVTCIGFNCSSCYPSIKGGKARCGCTDSNPKSDSRCDMSTRITIGF
jgi:hypothetical protein